MENTDDWDGLAAVGLVVQVGLSELDSRATFGRGGGGSDPDEDSVDGVNNENVGWVEGLAVERNFFNLEGSAGVRDLQDLLLVSEVGVVSSISGGFDWLLSSEVAPEEVGVGVLVVISENEDFDLGSALVIDGTGQLQKS